LHSMVRRRRSGYLLCFNSILKECHAMGKMSDDWKTAKKRFEILTGKHKPAKSFLIFFHESTNVDKYLKECDALAEAKTVDAVKLKAAAVKLKSASDTYLGTLKAEKSVETGGDKSVVTVMSKALSSLRQSLKKYEAYFESALASASTPTGKDIKQNMIDKVLATYKADVKAALANAKAAGAQLNAVAQKLAKDSKLLKVSVANYNKLMNSEEAARKLTTALGGYINLEKLGADVSNLTDPKAFIRSLDDYSARVDVSDTISVKDLITKIKNFETAVKTIGASYK